MPKSLLQFGLYNLFSSRFHFYIITQEKFSISFNKFNISNYKSSGVIVQSAEKSLSQVFSHGIGTCAIITGKAQSVLSKQNLMVTSLLAIAHALGHCFKSHGNCLALSRPKTLFPLCLCAQFQVGLPGSREAKHTASFWCYLVSVDSVFHSSL